MYRWQVQCPCSGRCMSYCMLAQGAPASAASRQRHWVTLRACRSPPSTALVKQWLPPFNTVIRVSGMTAPAAISTAFSVARPAGSKARLAGICRQCTDQGSHSTLHWQEHWWGWLTHFKTLSTGLAGSAPSAHFTQWTVMRQGAQQQSHP